MPRRLAIALLAAAFVALTLLVASGFGYRGGTWELGTAFTMIKWAAYLGVAVSVLAIIAIAIARPIGRTTVLLTSALVIAASTAFIPWRWKQRAGTVPPIHDITTDTKDPPPFVAVLPLRAKAKNPAEYGGDSIAALQRAGYPSLGPLVMRAVPGDAFARARAAAGEMGWDLVAADSAGGRIEATATTTWFGFKDDVVVRIRPSGAGSVVDVRSVSRLGGSDVGTNAARIEAFLARLSGTSAPD